MELPLVITKVGMFANAPDDITCAELVEVGDYMALAKSMEKLLTDAKKRGDLIKSGREAVQKYTWEAMASTVNDLYAKQ
jgi:glycosyltransferase involved in cell wall biosynthesis